MEKYKEEDDKLDILDEKGEKTGKTASYEEVHSQGLLHPSVRVWVANKKGELLLQKRAENVACPLHWDNSSGGHVVNGQAVLETAQKETREELGLDLSADKFNHLFRGYERVVSDGGKYIENTFYDVYVVFSDLTIEEFKINKDEVKEVRWVGQEEINKWIKEKTELMTPREEEYKKVFEYLETK